MKRAVSLMILVLLAAFNAAVSRAEVIGVWAVGDGEKVFRYDGEHPAKVANSVWDASRNRISLRGLYNEVLAFQVIVEADSFGASAVEISMDPPVHISSGRVIGAAGLQYGPGGSIEIFSQHYIRVTQPTQPLWFYGSETSAPKKMTGWIPDALITPDALPGRGGFPIDIPRARTEVYRRQNILEVTPTPTVQNQGFWVDVYLPRDRSWPAGDYESLVRVREGGREVATVPVRITLLPHYLPDENHSNIWLYGSLDVVARYFPDLPRDQVERMLKFECHRHRIDMVGSSNAHRSPFDEADMDGYKKWLDGSAFTAANGYHGPGQGKGEKLFTVGIYGSITGRAFHSLESTRAESDKWVSWFEKNAPGVTYFWYMIDEPGPVQFDWISERADWVHSNPGPGKRLPVFTTRNYTKELDKAIDIWAGHDGVDLDMMPELRGQGKDHWFYNGARPRYGAVILEADAVDFRVNSWVKYIHNVNTWFLWEGTTWTHNMQGPKGHLHQRVFSEPLTFISERLSWANGDGIVFYPGRNPYYETEDRGVNRILGSIRLKNMRRGRQDYEIMRLAEQKVGREKVLEIVGKVVPRSLEAEMKKDPVAWSERGDDYDRARSQLLDLLD